MLPHFQRDLSGPNLRSSSEMVSFKDWDNRAFVWGMVLRLARTARGFVRGEGRILAVSLELSLAHQTSKIQASFESVARSKSQRENSSFRAAASLPSSGAQVSRS